MVIDLRYSFGDPDPDGETPDTALPDETLTCCGQTWATHAAWMAHYKTGHNQTWHSPETEERDRLRESLINAVRNSPEEATPLDGAIE